MRYAREYNGVIERFNTLPHKLSVGGSIVMGLRSMDAASLANIGIYPLEVPTYNAITQKLGSIVWDSVNSVFTYSVVDIDGKLSGVKKILAKRIKDDVASVHQAIQMYITFKSAISENVPKNVQNNIDTFYSYVKTLRDSVKAINTIEEARQYTIDTTKLETARAYFEGLL